MRIFSPRNHDAVRADRTGAEYDAAAWERLAGLVEAASDFVAAIGR